jgi:hypothetical protein
VKQPAVQHSLEPTTQPLQLQSVSRLELGLNPTLNSLLPSKRECGLRYIDAQDRQPQCGHMKRVLPTPTPHIKHRTSESTCSYHPHDGRLRPTKVPRRRPTLVRRIPRQPRHPLMTSRPPTPEWILSKVFWSLRHPDHLPAADPATGSWWMAVAGATLEWASRCGAGYSGIW